MRRNIVPPQSKNKKEKGGILKCIIPSTESRTSPTDLGDESAMINVVYTTPYSYHNEGGFVAIPAPNTEILVMRVDGIYYYISSIIGDDGLRAVTTGDTDERVTKNFSIDRKNHNTYDKSTQHPDTVTWKHPSGHRFTMVEEHPLVTDEVDEGTSHTSYIRMQSAEGKLISLDDSREVDAARFGVMSGREKEIFDGIIISGEGKNKHMARRCISITTKNSIHNTSYNGGITNTIVDGTNFSVENMSTGFKTSAFAGPDFGNINLGTEFKDVNIVAGTTDMVDAPVMRTFPPLASSKIFIEANRASPLDPTPPLIRINSGGSIDIYSSDEANPLTGVINIRAVGDLNLESTLGNINMSAPVGSINLLAPTPVHPTTGLPGGVNIQGATIKLNDPTKLVIDPFLENYMSSPVLRGYLPFPIWLV